MVSPRAAPVIPELMAPASPAPKRPRQRDQVVAPATKQDVTLPQVISEVADLHARFAHDETFVTGMHDAVDRNAVILTDVLMRLVAFEVHGVTSAQVVIQLAHDAKQNDDTLDAQLRAELNSMTSHWGNELRKENAKVADSMKILEGIANAAVNAVRAFTASPHPAGSGGTGCRSWTPH